MFSRLFAAIASHITMEKKEKIFKAFGIRNVFLLHSEIQLDFTLSLKTPRSYTKAFVYPNIMVSHVCFPRWGRQGNKLQLSYYFFLTFLVQNRKSNVCIVTLESCFPLLSYMYFYMNKKGLICMVMFISVKNWLPLVIFKDISMMINIEHTETHQVLNIV